MRNIALIIIATLAVLLIGTIRGGTPAQAQAALFPCLHAPADYIAAFDAIDGTVDGAVSYAEPRAYYEAQGQLAPPGETERHMFEHIHIATCYPYAETWAQPNAARTLDMAYTFHNVENYNITKAEANFVAVGSSGKGFLATAAQLAELEAAMDASGNGATTRVFQHQALKGTIGLNCRRTGKMALTVVRANAQALVDEWEPGLHLTTYINYPGQGTCTPELQVDQMRARDWTQPVGGYIYSAYKAMPKAGDTDEPVTDPWPVTLDAVDQNVLLMIDPNLHVPNNLGVWSHDYGEFFGVRVVDVPTTALTSGPHRLMFYGRRGDHVAVMVAPFTVAGGC